MVTSGDEMLTLLQMDALGLKARCTAAGLPTGGSKAEQQHRLLQKMLKRPPTQGSLPTEQQPAWQEAVEAIVAPILAQLQELTGLRTQVEQTTAEVVALRAEKTDLLQRLDNTDNKVSALQSSFAAMQAAAGQAADAEERARRRPNLIIAKLGAKSQADADALVPQLLSTLGVACRPTAVRLLSNTLYADAARAAPGPSGAGPGAGRVLVKFSDVQDKISIYKAAKKLQGSPHSHVQLDDDLTPAQSQIRRSRQPHFQKLWEDQQRPRWRGVEIMVAGRIWRPSEPPKRPPSSSSALASLPVQSSVTTTLTTSTPLHAA